MSWVWLAPVTRTPALISHRIRIALAARTPAPTLPRIRLAPDASKPAFAMLRVGVALMLIVLAIWTPASADERALDMLDKLEIGELTSWAGADGLEPRAMLERLVRDGDAWDGDALIESGKALLLGGLRRAFSMLPGLFLPALLCAVGQRFASNATAPFVCVLVLATALAEIYTETAAIAREALTRVCALTGALYPILTALLAGMGRVRAAASFPAVAAFAGGLIDAQTAAWALGVTGTIAALSIAGNLSGRVRLGSLARLLRTGFQWMLTAVLTVFTGLVAAQGALSRAHDGVTRDAAKLALGSLLPVVGGEVADSLDALLASANLVRNAVGVTGLTLLIGAMLAPMTRLLGAVLGVRIASALCEPLGVGAPCRMLDEFAHALALLPALLAGACVLLVVLIGAGLALFG